MASHESYYASNNASGSPFPQPTPTTSIPSTGPPPPPPPKSRDPSRTSTPSVPPVPPHPNSSQAYRQSQHYPSNPASPAPSSNPAYQIQSQPQYHPQQSHPHSQPPPPPPPQQQQNQTTSPPTQSFSQQPQASPSAIPALDSRWLPDGLKDYSTADLQPLVNNSELLDAFAKQHPAYSAALEPLQAAVSTNLALAQHVAQLEEQVQQLRDQTGQLLINHTSLQTQWRRKQVEMDDALSSWGPRAMYSRLVSSISEQESLLRAVHDSFVEGGGETQEFYGSSDGKATEKEVTEWIKRIREGTAMLEKRREMRQRWDEGRVGGWR